MDCDDVALLLARGAPVEDEHLADHLATCEACRELVQSHQSAQLALSVVDPALFVVGEEIAAGGMGKIFRAFDRRLGREVAIKEMLSPALQGRFEREATITSRLQHPAIVPIYEAGVWPDGRAFYAMRLVSGGTLADAIAACPTLEARLALLPNLLAVTDAVAYAHSRGVIHRDLKPHNVLIGEFGETVVIDWGLAKDRDAIEVAAVMPTARGATHTQAGAVLGTPGFMAPEQARGDEIDERADVFALGAMLYHLMTAAMPYWDTRRSSEEVVAAVVAGPPTPLRTLAPRTPADLVAIIERAMARDPAARYADASAIAAELRRFQAGQLLVERAYPVRELVARWLRRHRTLVTVVGAAVAVAGIVAIIAAVEVTRAQEAEREQRTIAEKAIEIGARRGQRKLCAASRPDLSTPWDATARDQVHRAFDRAALPFVTQTIERVDANLDRWSAQLTATVDKICEETAAAETNTSLPTQLACLADRTREGRALIQQFHDVDRTIVTNAISASAGLASPERCFGVAKPRVALPPSPAVNSVRDKLAQSRVLMELGKYRLSLPIAQGAVTEADAVGDPSLRAAARVALGAAQIGLSQLPAAYATDQEALQIADTAQDDRSRAQAWVNIVHIEFVRGRYEQAVSLQAAVLGATERIEDIALQTEAMLYLGGALGQLGKNVESQALFERAVALRRKRYGERDPMVATALSALGNTYAMQGDLARGIAAHAEAVALGRLALGDAHPIVATMHGNLGSDYIFALRPADALRELETQLASATAAYGAKHHLVASGTTDLCTALVEAGDAKQALATCTVAIDTWREVNPKHPALADALLGRYLANQALGAPASVADLEAALPLAKAGLAPFQLARIQFALGKATSSKRAIELVQAAAAGYATTTLPLCVRDLDAAKVWLAAHHAPLSAASPAKTP